MILLALFAFEAAATAPRECSAQAGGPFGKLLRFSDAGTMGSTNTDSAARLVWVTTATDRTPIPITAGMNVCVGDLIEVWHRGQVVIQAEEERDSFTLEGGSLTWIKGAREADLMRGFADWYFAPDNTKPRDSTFHFSAGQTLISQARSTVRVGVVPKDGVEPCPPREVFVEVLERDPGESSSGSTHSVTVTPWPGAEPRVVTGGTALRVGADGRVEQASRATASERAGFAPLAKRAPLERVARSDFIRPPVSPGQRDVSADTSSRLDQGIEKFAEARHAAALHTDGSGLTADAAARAREAIGDIRAFLAEASMHRRAPEARFALATVLGFLGELDASAAEYRLLVESAPVSEYTAAAYARLGDAWFARGDMVEAMRAYEGASGDAQLGPYVRRQLVKCRDSAPAGLLQR